MKIALSCPPCNDNLYTAAEVRELDRLAIEEHGIAASYLMKRAGRAAFEVLLEQWPEVDRLTVYCGIGNNAGDGYVIAALAAQRRLHVDVVQLGDVAALSGAAKAAYDYACQEQVSILKWSDVNTAHQLPHGGVLVDALLGTGLTRNVEGDYADAITAINNSGLPVLAVDMPSGLCADTGTVKGCAVKAQLTTTFIGLKRGLLTGRGPALSGEVFFDDLDVPSAIYSEVNAQVDRLNLHHLLTALPEREADAHKGHFGHVMVIGGDLGFGGAGMMAAEAAARMGAGLVSLATRPEHVVASLARQPEIMAVGVTSGQELEPLLKRPSVLVIGPGLGRSPWSEQMLLQAAQSGLPMIVDADALALLASTSIVEPSAYPNNWILTPHPGEAAALLECDVASVQADRFAAVIQLQQRYGGVVILKGAGSLVKGEDEHIGLVSDGNPGMASGGMGDVLSGILAGLLAQGLTAAEAAELGATLHACAADFAAEEVGQRSLLATDVIPYICELLRD